MYVTKTTKGTTIQSSNVTTRDASTNWVITIVQNDIRTGRTINERYRQKMFESRSFIGALPRRDWLLDEPGEYKQGQNARSQTDEPAPRSVLNTRQVRDVL